MEYLLYAIGIFILYLIVSTGGFLTIWVYKGKRWKPKSTFMNYFLNLFIPGVLWSWYIFNFVVDSYDKTKRKFKE